MAFHRIVAIRRRTPPEMIMVADKSLGLQHLVPVQDYFICHAFKSDVVQIGIASMFRALDRATGSFIGDLLGQIALVAFHAESVVAARTYCCCIWIAVVAYMAGKRLLIELAG
jgi:hypothetical protein